MKPTPQKDIPVPRRAGNPNARLAFWITNPILEFEDIPVLDDPEEEYLQEAEAWEHFLRAALSRREAGAS